MKTNIYIVSILLLSFSFGNAQSTTETIKKDDNKVVSVSVEDTMNPVEVVEDVKENDVQLINAEALKETIARTSDIRRYFNRVRNVDNLKLLFPKMNTLKRA